MSSASVVLLSDTSSSTFHSDLRALRVAYGFTQAELAHRVGVTQRTVSFWESPPDDPLHIRPVPGKLHKLMTVLNPAVMRKKSDDISEEVTTAAIFTHAHILMAKEKLASLLGVPVDDITITIKY